MVRIVYRNNWVSSYIPTYCVQVKRWYGWRTEGRFFADFNGQKDAEQFADMLEN